MLSPEMLKYLKGYCIYKLAVAFCIPKECVDYELKLRFEYEKTNELTYDEAMEVIIYCFLLGDEIGLNLNFRDNEWDKIYDKDL